MKDVANFIKNGESGYTFYYLQHMKRFYQHVYNCYLN